MMSLAPKSEPFCIPKARHLLELSLLPLLALQKIPSSPKHPLPPLQSSYVASKNPNSFVAGLIQFVSAPELTWYHSNDRRYTLLLLFSRYPVQLWSWLRKMLMEEETRSKFKRICVFCGSHPGHRKVFRTCLSREFADPVVAEATLDFLNMNKKKLLTSFPTLLPQTPLQTPMVQTPLPGTAQTPLPGTSDNSYNIPTGGTPITPNDYPHMNENGLHEMIAGRPSP